jgi:two-component system response regulator NreC
VGEEGGETITIVLADDHAVVRSALHMLLDAEPGFEVVAEAGDARAAASATRHHRPRVLILDPQHARRPGARLAYVLKAAALLVP